MGCANPALPPCTRTGFDGLIADRNCDGVVAKGTLKHAEYKLAGEKLRDYAGFWVSTAGDVDSDGLDDVLVGAYGDDEGGSLAGAAYLLLGRSLGQSTRVDLADADHKFIGENSRDYAGFIVTSGGDLDGDGLNDILMGAPGKDDKGPTTGAVYVILGRSLGQEYQFHLSDADYRFIGESELDFAGYSLAGVGDVDGDMLDDILIGASGQGEGGESAGAAYLMMGHQLAGETTIDLADAAYKFVGETPYDWAGYVVNSAGDVDGDGLSDLLIGADGDVGGTQAHASYLVLAKNLGAEKTIDLADSDYKIIGEQSYDYASQVSSAGDVDGDGLGDIIIGAAGCDAGGPSAGAAYIVLGKSLGSGPLIDLANADYQFIGESPRDYAGAIVSGAGDVDGDGLSDVLIGAWQNDSQSLNQGAAYVVLGQSLTHEKMIDLSQADFKLIGDSAWDYAGIAVSTAGDIDGDGLDDVLVGAYSDDIQNGAAYIVTGG